MAPSTAREATWYREGNGLRTLPSVDLASWVRSGSTAVLTSEDPPSRFERGGEEQQQIDLQEQDTRNPEARPEAAQDDEHGEIDDHVALERRQTRQRRDEDAECD